MTASVPKHIFLSYSTRDQTQAERVLKYLTSCNISVWIDRAGLEPGTKDWEEAIRDAIRSSFAVLYLASPNSKESPFVNGELLFAQSHKCPIIPALIAGEWIDSARLDMANTQYVSIRDNDYDSGIKTIAHKLSKIIKERIPDAYEIDGTDFYDLGQHWANHLQVILPNRHTALMRNALNLTIEDFLDRFYVTFMRPFAKPSTYGRDWLIVCGYHVVQDWTWITSQVSNLFVYDPVWQKSVKLSEFIDNVEPDYYESLRVVTQLDDSSYFGIAFTECDSRIHEYFQYRTDKFLMGLVDGYYGQPCKPSEIKMVQGLKKYIIMVDQNKMQWLTGGNTISSAKAVYIIDEDAW